MISCCPTSSGPGFHVLEGRPKLIRTKSLWILRQILPGIYVLPKGFHQTFCWWVIAVFAAVAVIVIGGSINISNDGLVFAHRFGTIPEVWYSIFLNLHVGIRDFASAGFKGLSDDSSESDVSSSCDWVDDSFAPSSLLDSSSEASPHPDIIALAYT